MPQPRLFLSPPHMSGRERELVGEVFDSNWIAPVGPHLTQFEEAFAARVGVEHAAAVVSGTAALHMALRALKLQPGDEVCCSTFTFCASANPIVYENAQPVFIDSDTVSWNMDPNLLADELAECDRRGKLPKAVIVVDILGQAADMDAILEITNRYEIPVIDDAAEALGGTYKDDPIGQRGWAAAFSFNGNKIITTSGGGMLCSNDRELIEQTRFLSTQARDDAPYYLHSQIGFNYRLSNILAGVGLGQLEVLDDRVAARRETFAVYRDTLAQLPGVTMMPQAPYGESNCWLSVVVIDSDEAGVDCEQVRQSLEAENIESRRVWLPMHRQPVFGGCRCRGGAVSERVFETALCLPSGSQITTADRNRVIDAVSRAIVGKRQ